VQCVIANVDADDKKNADLARKYDISGYPTLKFFPADNKDGEDYNGGRSEANFVDFLNERCGTQRAVGGGLNDEVIFNLSAHTRYHRKIYIDCIILGRQTSRV
jgi:hypothetical protein